MGLLATKKLEPVGYVASGTGERIALAEGDEIFVKVNRPCSPGDLFTVYRPSETVSDPKMGWRVGYVVNFVAKIVVEQNISEGSWRGRIVESYLPFEVGAPILPYEPISSCVQPLPATSDMGTRIVGVKEGHDLIGQYTVVYLGKGYTQGIRRGHVFEVVTQRKLGGYQDASTGEVILGHLLVIAARPDTATGVIMSTDKELFQNITIRGVDWERAQQGLARLPRCTLE